MTPAEFKSARLACGLNLADWAIALGYRNTTRDGLRQQAHDMEAGRKAISPQVARLAEMYRRYGVPEDLRSAPET